jgi:mannose-6-phosphate isomerase-like protein (cupin superfamily)
VTLLVLFFSYTSFNGYWRNQVKISGDSVNPFDFRGLEIKDFTSGLEVSSSFAEITVPPGAVHPLTYSTRSDKYYYVVTGILQFTVEDKSYWLAAGDVCIISKNKRFSYRNDSPETAKVILIHTPPFDLESEVFKDDNDNYPRLLEE